ncbi:hypothetical protein VCUG_01974 [Vavraia culicis subsp. floridensis]|uniref:Uncharacterized protein n=1 Tax=Vavraia culicis (isolate floridensis) TaxID=948595 RepID=L2GSA3_VAVCU|nr:uncharacterized protein VCUG_01974 [Vavraia culicis subsp. floridensis]ELA46541.1 hypothetical protein VCUG_01974 [Vavraia culicis subsp. floridensis]
MRNNVLILLLVAVVAIALLGIAGYFITRRSKTTPSKGIKLGNGAIEGETAEKLAKSAFSALSSHTSYGPAVSNNTPSGQNGNVASVATSIWSEIDGTTTGNAKVDSHLEDIIRAIQTGNGQRLNEKLKSLSESDIEEIMNGILDMVKESPTVKKNLCFGWSSANASPSPSTNLIWTFALLQHKSTFSTFQQSIDAYLSNEQINKKLVAYPIFCIGYIYGKTSGVVLDEQIKVQDRVYLLKGVILIGGGSYYESSMVLVKHGRNYLRVDSEPEKNVNFGEECSRHPLALTFYEIH